MITSLNNVGINEAEVMLRYPHEFGGMKQRVMIAIALAKNLSY